ncbi:MAG: ASPIC/UnbV domain-containing protein [Verrucomicrobia bacterium]|nr:ASPIC/UnbV domain-containing protein [Verrucomicrobiota bacterium]
MSDFYADGRVDLVVAQNAAATKLFHNKTARPGLRIRLQSSAGNPSAVGAVLRVVSGGRSGPAREIHSGSGYWSQDSAVQVIAMPEGPAELSIRWPGGKVTTSLVPPGAMEISIDATGKVAVMR